MLLQGKRIFIVEDNVENRTITQWLLEQEGATVAFERWGTNTCELLQEFAPVDIILLDLMLPNKVTGFDVFDKIRKMPDFAAIPIVAVSAADTAVALPKARQKGFSGFIRKPVNFLQFARQVASIIQGEQVWQTN